MSKNFDELFRQIVTILRRDYAGGQLAGSRFDPRYYNTAIGQAWHDHKLDELLFLRYVSQMLACTGDRHLRLALRPSDAYAPHTPGFWTRRYGDSLYVTDVSREDRLVPGDRITALNGGSPAEHRARIQKNFFYADEPEREDWNGMLKMADTVDVEHADGRTERLALRHFPLDGASGDPGIRLREVGGTLLLDLRNAAQVSDDELFSLLPRICRRDTKLSELLDTELVVNYSKFNCLVKAAGLRGVEGAEPFIAELAEKSGKGFLPETIDDETIIPGEASGPVVVLTDTWTRDGAETLALAAKRAGAVLIGRPTLGTVDLCGDVSYELDEDFTLTWPTAVTKAALEGNGVFGRGAAPDTYVPWTPQECAEDVLLSSAMKYCKKEL